MFITTFLKQLKYKYYVTLPLYMLTKTERFILNTFFLVSLSMLFAAVYTYFPSHVKIIAQRAYYYYAGAQEFEGLQPIINHPSAEI
ncbi:hypothetical protein V1512DRAFT_265494 [Lipomyces arxii]|uniref:uncharacterized protein n=1 Tax=Lipomyces arxii TaxID=56418 RepID=UPI0034CD43CE